MSTVSPQRVRRLSSSSRRSWKCPDSSTEDMLQVPPATVLGTNFVRPEMSDMARYLDQSRYTLLNMVMGLSSSALDGLSDLGKRTVNAMTQTWGQVPQFSIHLKMLKSTISSQMGIFFNSLTVKPQDPRADLRGVLACTLCQRMGSKSGRSIEGPAGMV